MKTKKKRILPTTPKKSVKKRILPTPPKKSVKREYCLYFQIHV